MWDVGAGGGSAVGGGLSCRLGNPPLQPRAPGDRVGGSRSCPGVGKAECLGCVRSAVLCKAFPCGERECSVGGPGPPLAGLGAPCSARARDVGGAALGGAGREGHVGSEHAWLCPLRGRGAERADGATHSSSCPPLPPGGGRPWRLCTMWPTENWVRGVCSRLSLGVAAERWWPPGARGVLLTALLCAVGLWKGRVGPSPVVGSLENDLEFGRKKVSDIYLCVPSTALGSQ